MKARLLPALAVPGGFFFASLASRLAIARAPAHIAANDLAQPLAVVTNWGAFGAVQFGILFAALAVATIGYAYVVRTSRKQGVSLGWFVAVAVISAAAAWTLPAIFSSDVYAYAAYGEALRVGLNPYAHVVLPANDPVFSAAIWQWGNPLPVCVYGPLFVAIAAADVSAFAHAGVPVQLAGLRALATLAWMTCIPLAFAAYPGDRRARVAAALTIGLNPVAIWSAVEGHNDALAIAVVLCGFAAMQRGRPALGAALAALAGTIKLPALASAIGTATAGPRARLGAALGAAAAIALSIPLAVAALTQLAPQGRYAPEASFEAIVKPAAFLVFTNDAAATIATWTLAAAAAAFCAYRGIARLRSARPDGWIYVALAAWLLIPNPYPWYAMWLLPLAALAPATRAAATALWLSLASVLRYVPDAVGAPSPAAAAFLGIAATLPFLLLFGSESSNRTTNGAACP